MSVQKKQYHGPVEATVDILSGRWKPWILWVLRDGTLRFGQIEAELSGITPNITQRMLTKQLRELENDGLVARKVYPEVPPRVEYTLTEKYKSLLPIVEQMYAWGKEHMADQIEHECEQERKSTATGEITPNCTTCSHSVQPLLKPRTSSSRPRSRRPEFR